jgi:hypothetical protein
MPTEATINIVTSRAVYDQLVSMAGVTSTDAHAPTPAVLAGTRGLARFMVCAAMLLGHPDAMMLAVTAKRDPGDAAVYFPGWEIL